MGQDKYQDVSDSLRRNWENINKRAEATAEKCGRAIEEIQIIAVSKTQAPGIVKAGVDNGILTLGENYAQEARDKQKFISENCANTPEWHFIGHLQTNKVKYIAPFISMIHSVDSVKLAREISKQADRNDRIIDILLQVNTSGELSKSGCDPENLLAIAEEVLAIDKIIVKGLMTIGSFSEDEGVFRREFRLLRSLRDDLNDKMGLDLKHLSMGMTHDFEEAIEEGATKVRVGTAIFGPRNYK